MNKILSIVALLLTVSVSSFGQKISEIKLNDQEIPAGYTTVGELQCKSLQASLLYENPEMYSFIFGDLGAKEFQSFKSNNDSGSILYLEFKKNIKSARGFLSGLLWGDAGKPTKSHPEEFEIRDNVLVIWSLNKKSAVKEISRDKVIKAYK